MTHMLKDWEEEVMEALLLGHGDRGKCEMCEEETIMVECSSRRMDTDKVYNLCPICASEHHQYWDDMWAEYYRGIM